MLDEIAEMPIELQAKLLRVLEERKFRPLGAEEEITLDARIVAATNVDLERRIEAGTFREDPYFRLNVVTIDVPSLSQRGDDIPHWCRPSPRIKRARCASPTRPDLAARSPLGRQRT